MPQRNALFNHLIPVLAQEDAPPQPPSSGQVETPVTEQPQQPAAHDPGQQQPSMPPFFFIIFAALVVMIIFSMSGQRREKKKREKMLAGLKKGDRVQTIGGILGAAVEVRDEHVVVKIDENTNTRVKFSRSAIQAVLPDKDE